MPAKLVKDLTTDDVMSVYSGKDGKCMCGCSGKYSYNPKYREIASEDRGYEVTEDECNLRTVSLVLNKVKNAGHVEFGGNHYWFATEGGFSYSARRHGGRRLPGRQYVVYLKPSDKELEDRRASRAQFAEQQAAAEARKKREALEAIIGVGI